MSSFPPKTEAEQEARQLIKRLKRLNREWPSEPTLDNLSPLTVDALLKHIEAQDKSNVQTGIIVTTFLMLCLCSIVIIYHQPFLLFVVPFWLYYLYLWSCQEDEKPYATYALTRTDDMRALNPLLLEEREKFGQYHEILRAIKRLLGQVTEEHAGLLTNEAQVALWRLALNPLSYHDGYDEELALIALQVFTCIGNKSMLKRMQECIRLIASYRMRRRVSNVLKQLVPIMEARLQRQEVPQTLLRAADMPTSQPETLLRAVYATSPEPQEHLLRAFKSEQPETDA